VQRVGQLRSDVYMVSKREKVGNGRGDARGMPKRPREARLRGVDCVQPVHRLVQSNAKFLKNDRYSGLIMCLYAPGGVCACVARQNAPSALARSDVKLRLRVNTLRGPFSGVSWARNFRSMRYVISEMAPDRSTRCGSLVT